jgi:hypothetical protein
MHGTISAFWTTTLWSLIKRGWSCRLVANSEAEGLGLKFVTRRDA